LVVSLKNGIPAKVFAVPVAPIATPLANLDVVTVKSPGVAKPPPPP
jgi:hypothetical protein